MAMRVTKLELRPGVWRLRVEWKDEKGERRFRYETVKGTADDAEVRRAELVLGQIEDAKATRQPGLQGVAAQHGTLLLSTYARRWLDQRIALGNFRGQTEHIYRHLLEHHVIPTWGHLPLRSLTRDIITQGLVDLAKKRKHSPRTLRAIRSRLFAVLSEAQQNNLIETNPATKIKLPRPPRTAGKIMSDPQTERLLTKVRGHRLGCIIRFALSTGARRGEMVGLVWGDFNEACTVVKIDRSIADDGRACWVVPPKTEAGKRTISLFPEMAAEMRARRTQDAIEAKKRGLDLDTFPVFRNVMGERWTPRRLTAALGKLLEDAGLDDFTVHDLRHAHASALLRSGANPRAVAERLGHGDPSITLSIYAHVLPSDDKHLAVAIGRELGKLGFGASETAEAEEEEA
jgi:integrase